jgi:hypothetical protein
MSWLSSFFVGVLTAITTAVAGGFVAAGCVSWYRISSREGQSGYFVVVLVLLSAVVGFFGGLILSRFFGGAGASGFFAGWGISAGAMLGLTGALALVAWGLADIPPTINGHELDFVIEARLPKGAEKPPVLEGKQFVWFESGPKRGASRVHEFGLLDASKARQVDGRWVVPGSVRIFTTRDTRSVAIQLSDKEAIGFELQFPGHPGPEYKQWSGWLPDAVAQHWPESEMSYRFRVEERIPVVTPTPPDPFNALTSDSPLEEWLKFFDGFARVPERYQAIMKQVEARPADLAKVLKSSNDEDHGKAMDATAQLKVVDPIVLQAMRDVAADIAEQIRKFNAMSPQQEGYDALGGHIQSRFNRWCAPWEMVQDRSGVDGRPPVEEILKLASVQKGNTYMQGVASDAQVLLGYLAGAHKKPE